MTHDDVTKHSHLAALRAPPWAEEPGRFLLQLIPSGLVDPKSIEASGMMSAILHAKGIWGAQHPQAILKVTHESGTEVFMGRMK